MTTYTRPELADFEELRDEHGLSFEEITPYQLRIEGTLDIYPTRRKWHDITKNKRGVYPLLIPFVLHHFKAVIHLRCPKCKHHFLQKA